MNETYNVAVKLSLNNQVSAGLLGLSRQFGKTSAEAAALQSRLNSIKILALTGIGLTAAGFFGLHIFEKMMRPAEEYAHQLNSMNMAVKDQAKLAEAVGAAWKNTGVVITTTATDNLRMLNDMRVVFGDVTEATKALPLVSQMQAVLMSSKEGKSVAGDKDFAFSVAKALDIIGAVKNKDEFMIEANMMAKNITAFQGRVTPKMFQSTFAYARQAKYALDNEFKYEILGTLMMEYAQGTSGAGGGSRGVGPMIAALYRMTNQGYINKKSLPELIRVGLVDKHSALKTTTSGTTVGAMKEAKLAGENPFKWVQTVLVPALQKTYGHDGKPLTRDELQFHINQLFRGNQLAGNLLTEFAIKPYAFLRDQKLIRQAMTPEQAYQSALIKDPQLARTALHAQWENVETALTVPLVTVLIPALMHLATALNAVAIILQKYPTLAASLSYGFVALFGAMAIGGIVLLLTAAFQGLSVALTLMAGPLVALGVPILGAVALIGMFAFGIYQLYQTLKDFSLSGLFSELSNIRAALMKSDVGRGIVFLFESLFGLFKNSPLGLIISEFKLLFSTITNGISGVVGAIKGIIPAWAANLAAGAAKGAANAVGSNLGNLSPKTTPTGKPTASNVHSNSTIQVATNINLDGRHLARVVTQHQVNDAIRIPNYTQGYDPNMSPTPMVLKGNIA